MLPVGFCASLLAGSSATFPHGYVEACRLELSLEASTRLYSSLDTPPGRECRRARGQKRGLKRENSLEGVGRPCDAHIPLIDIGIVGQAR
jgi:hypothetical protein